VARPSRPRAFAAAFFAHTTRDPDIQNAISAKRSHVNTPRRATIHTINSR
jgi:hypothetical protein